MCLRLLLWSYPHDIRKEFREIVKESAARLRGRVSVDELRRELSVKPEDLVEEIETYDIEHLELKEKERLK